MKNLWYVLLALLTVSACKDKSDKATDNNPLFKSSKLKDITEKINDKPDDAALYYQRGILLHEMQEDSMAIVDFKKATSLDSSKAEYFSAIGDILFEHKDISASVPYIEKAIKLNPEDKKAQLKLAKLFVFIKEYTKAFQAINTVLRQDVYAAEGYFLKGMIYKDLKDTSKAISSFRTAVQVDADYKDAYIQLGQLFSIQKDPIALAYYDNAYKTDTTDVFPLFARGVFYQDMKEYELAKKEYRNTILHNRLYLDAYFNTGYVLMQQDSFEKAIRQYELIANLDQTNAEAYYNKGLCYELMGKKQEAIKEYKQALVFDEAYDMPKEGLKRLGVK
ncbi:hypothetical protein CAP35_13450 [Chitinophagaceae bacterium IBVUCB1]|nr:hypothetical protein CAP35_13450 [Chitinophagaceae bacterium IBVUCB1]